MTRISQRAQAGIAAFALPLLISSVALTFEMNVNSGRRSRWRAMQRRIGTLFAAPNATRCAWRLAGLKRRTCRWQRSSLQESGG